MGEFSSTGETLFHFSGLTVDAETLNLQLFLTNGRFGPRTKTGTWRFWSRTIRGTSRFWSRTKKRNLKILTQNCKRNQEVLHQNRYEESWGSDPELSQEPGRSAPEPSQEPQGSAPVPFRRSGLTVLLEDQHNAGDDLHELRRHHGGRGQVPGSVSLQGSGVPHGQHQGGGLEHQHPQGQVLQLGWGHVCRPSRSWRSRENRERGTGRTGGRLRSSPLALTAPRLCMNALWSRGRSWWVDPAVRTAAQESGRPLTRTARPPADMLMFNRSPDRREKKPGKKFDQENCHWS